MIDHQKKTEELIMGIFEFIKTFVEKDEEKYEAIGIILSSLSANIAAFVRGEEAWDGDTKKEVIGKIHAELMRSVE